LRVELDDTSGDIHLLEGPHFRGIQFHAESILTQNGYDILRDLVTAVLD
jgi:phenazine biosynthesis protein phzE